VVGREALARAADPDLAADPARDGEASPFEVVALAALGVGGLAAGVTAVRLGVEDREVPGIAFAGLVLAAETALGVTTFAAGVAFAARVAFAGGGAFAAGTVLGVAALVAEPTLAPVPA
jgi:hypothetical protein